MIQVITMYDKVNLYDLTTIICEYAKKSVTENIINTREKIISILFNGVVPSYATIQTLDNYQDFGKKIANLLKKYVSYDFPVDNSNINDMVNAFKEKFDEKNLCHKTFFDNCLKLAHELSKVSYLDIFEIFYKNCNFVNFPNDLQEIETLYKKICSDDRYYAKARFLYILYSHAISNYKSNLPKFYSYRLYQEALTLTHGSEMQKRMFKEAADVCSQLSQKSLAACQAATQYANLISHEDDKIEETLKYFQIASQKLPSAYWEIAFMIENNRLENKITNQVEQQIERYFSKELTDLQICSRTDIDSSYKLVICPVDLLDTENEKNIIVAFKIYWGLSQKEKFSKALNSVGKFLINKMVVCMNPVTKEFDEKRSYLLAKDFLKEAMSLGNTNAMVNLGNYYFLKYQASELSKEDEDIMIQLLKNASDIFYESEACKILGDYYFINNDFITSEQYFRKSLINTKNGYSYFMLGKLEVKKLNSEIAINYFQKAIQHDYYDAAFFCAKQWRLMYYNEIVANKDSHIAISYLQLAKEFLETFMSAISNKFKIEAEQLMQTIKYLLQ